MHSLPTPTSATHRPPCAATHEFPTTRACPNGWGRSGVLRHQLAAQRAIAFLQGTGYAARRATAAREPGAVA